MTDFFQWFGLVAALGIFGMLLIVKVDVAVLKTTLKAHCDKEPETCPFHVDLNTKVETIVQDHRVEKRVQEELERQIEGV